MSLAIHCSFGSIKSWISLAMGQNPNRNPSEHPNPTTKKGTKMGGEFTYPKVGSHWF